jgi:hypothetical protein
MFSYVVLSDVVEPWLDLRFKSFPILADIIYWIAVVFPYALALILQAILFAHRRKAPDQA